MKITKRIFAIALAALMLAMLVPFTASAAEYDGPYSVKVNGKKDFQATIYKMADFDPETGEFKALTSNAPTDGTGSNTVASFVNDLKSGYNGGTDANADLLKKALALGVPATPAATSSKFTSTTYEFVNITTPGVYLLKWTSQPSEVTAAQSALFCLPYYSGAAWYKTVEIGDAKTNAGEPTATKTFTTGDGGDGVPKYVESGEVVNFTLKGSVPGSATTPAQRITFYDDMTVGGLKFEGNLNVYGVTAAGAETALDASAYTVTGATKGSKTFTVNFDGIAANQIAPLYAAGYTDIKITFDAKLTGEGIDYTSAGNDNTLTYDYTNNSGVDSDPITKTRKVITYQFKVKKVDAKTNAALQNAEFSIFTDAAATTRYTNEDITAPKKTSASGIVEFKGLKADTVYYIKETGVPSAEYTINSHVFPIYVATNGKVYSGSSASGTELTDLTLVVANTKVVMPNTGGTGTILFTVCGVALIAAAGVLFVVYRKKSAK